MKIYTKTGDQGKTSLLSGKRVLKSDARLDGYGTVDELNSYLGLCIAHLNSKPKKTFKSELGQKLTQIQNDLFNVGSLLACDSATLMASLPRVPAARVEDLEITIDQFEKNLKPLKNFILPGGSIASSHLHVARTICRRAERLVTALYDKDPSLEDVVIYLNRLSDFLFVAARFVNHKMKTKETIWTKD